MKRNTRLLLKAAKRIEEIPQSYDQATFRRYTDKSPCGMAGCLGGEIIICSERSVNKGINKLSYALRKSSGIGSPYWPGYLAADLAGFSRDEAKRLFYNVDGGEWPDKFRDQFQKAKTEKGRAGVAVKLLRYLAEGGEV